MRGQGNVYRPADYADRGTGRVLPHRPPLDYHGSPACVPASDVGDEPCPSDSGGGSERAVLPGAALHRSERQLLRHHLLRLRGGLGGAGQHLHRHTRGGHKRKRHRHPLPRGRAHRGRAVLPGKAGGQGQVRLLPGGQPALVRHQKSRRQREAAGNPGLLRRLPGPLPGGGVPGSPPVRPAL